MTRVRPGRRAGARARAWCARRTRAGAGRRRAGGRGSRRGGRATSSAPVCCSIRCARSLAVEVRSRIASAAALWARVETVASAIRAVCAIRSSASPAAVADVAADPRQIVAQRDQLRARLEHHRADVGAQPGLRVGRGAVGAQPDLARRSPASVPCAAGDRLVDLAPRAIGGLRDRRSAPSARSAIRRSAASPARRSSRRRPRRARRASPPPRGRARRPPARTRARGRRSGARRRRAGGRAARRTRRGARRSRARPPRRGSAPRSSESAISSRRASISLAGLAAQRPDLVAQPAPGPRRAACRPRSVPAREFPSRARRSAPRPP